MITVNCDACEKPFQVSDDLAGGKAPCPACGDVKRIPAGAGGGGGAERASPGDGLGGAGGGGVAAAADRAASAGLPPTHGPEATVLRAHSAIFKARPLAAVMVLLGALAGAVGTVVFAITPGALPMAILCAAVLVGCLIIVVCWKLSSWATRLEVTNKRIIFTRGILSKSTVEMLHRTIQDIEIRQTFLDRMLNVGTINIANASEDDDAIVVASVPDPYRIRKAIDVYRPM
ncbi:MAG: PH domain-containing protein [Phycisphaerales bacterium]